MSYKHVPIVIDNGGGLLKAGFAGENAPRVVFPTIVGHPRNRQTFYEKFGPKPHFIGDEALYNRADVLLNRPIEQGRIVNWDDMETIWRFAFNELGVNPKEHPVILTEQPNNSNPSREMMKRIMFKTFHVPKLFIGITAVELLKKTGRRTGLVLDSGFGRTTTIPIHEGVPIPYAIMSWDLGGQDLDDFMVRILNCSGHRFAMISEPTDARCIKEKLGYVAEDFNEEMQKAASSSELERSFTTQSGKTIVVGNEQFVCPEALFQPSFLGKNFAEGIFYFSFFNF